MVRIGLGCLLAVTVLGCSPGSTGGSDCPGCMPPPPPPGEDAGTVGPSSRCAADPDCAAGSFCSAGGVCIPEGTCGSDGDCAAGAFCSAGRACIADGSCAVDADCAATGTMCDLATATCVLGSACGAEEFTAEPVAPNVLIVLDRSCSMRRAAGGVPKWTSAVSSINELTVRFEGSVRWGLTLFPDRAGRECQQDEWPVHVGDGTEPAIRSILTAALMESDRNYPNGPCVTNIDTAMEQAEGEPALMDPDRMSHVLLVTDGAQSSSCRGGSDTRTFEAVDRLAARGVNTSVVGFGDAVDAGALSELARRGGTARAGAPTPYYQADDAAGLAIAFDEIIRSVMSCTYRLGSEPSDPDDVYVFFDDTRMVPRDGTRSSGWDYAPDSRTVTFFGAPCDELRRGDVSDVDVVFGCPEPTID